MGITRTPMPFERDYVQVPNAWLRDERLSRRARGLLAELMTHRAGWHVTIGSLQKSGPEGRDAIRSAVHELAEHGYLIRRQTQDAGGRFLEVEYEISDPTAVGKYDTGGFPDDGSPDGGESDTKKTTSEKTIESEDSPSPEARVIDEAFERAYGRWPKRVERKRSLSAFRAAAKKRDVHALEADVIRFGDAYTVTTDKQFTPSLAVWLKGERWNDDPPTRAMPTEAEWNALLAGTDDSAKPPRALDRAPRCETHGHRFLPDGTCNFCPAHLEDVPSRGAA